MRETPRRRPGSRAWVFALTAALLAAVPVRADRAGVTVEIDPRVELLGVVYRLGGHPEFTQGHVRSYLDDVDSVFAPYRDHAVVALSQELRKTHSVSFDAVMQMALHIDDAFDPEPLRPLDDPSLTLYEDGRWTPADARRFIRQLADFARTSDFRDFYEDHAALYDDIRRAMQVFVDEHLNEEWFQDFFGVAPAASFTVVPSMINGPASYGPKVREADGSETFYAIIGVNAVDEHGAPRIDPEATKLIVHEFCHSFVNPLVRARRGAFESSARAMLEKVRPAMERMAYSKWEIMVDESLVRVAVIRYLRAHEGVDAAVRQTRKEVERSFVWMPELSDLMAGYEKTRDRYPTFESFLPGIETFFDAYAPGLDSVLAERERVLEERRPHVVATDPVNGSTDVDPAATHLTLTFDRPMSGGYSMNPVAGDPPGRQPEMTDFDWNSDGTVLTVEWRLEPDTRYAFTLNPEGFAGFKTRDRVPLKSYTIRFRTRPE